MSQVTVGLQTKLSPIGASVQATLDAGQTNILLTPGTYPGLTSVPPGTTIKCQEWQQCILLQPAVLTIGVNGGGVPGTAINFTAYSYSAPNLTLTGSNSLTLLALDDIRFGD